MSAALVNRAWRLRRYPRGMPSVEDFELFELPRPDPVGLAEGQVLLRAEYLSVDPYMRTRMKPGPGYLMDGFEAGDAAKPIDGFAVSRVVAAAAGSALREGDVVHGFLPWQEFAVVASKAVTKVDADAFAPSAYLGVLGLTGLSAYFPCLEIGKPRPGETAFVSAAAGAVGSVAGQIFKLQGCRVVGSAGSADKIGWLQGDLGFDGALNYKVSPAELDAQLSQLCPGGIDVYFHMNTNGRIIACGAISEYSAQGDVYGVKNMFMVVAKQLTIQGFLLNRWRERFPEGRAQLAEWLRAGKLTQRETMLKGFEKMPEAMVSLLTGGNTGKLCVQASL
eukprot:g6600.t1